MDNFMSHIWKPTWIRTLLVLEPPQQNDLSNVGCSVMDALSNLKVKFSSAADCLFESLYTASDTKVVTFGANESHPVWFQGLQPTPEERSRNIAKFINAVLMDHFKTRHVEIKEKFLLQCQS